VRVLGRYAESADFMKKLNASIFRVEQSRNVSILYRNNEGTVILQNAG